MPDGSPPTWPVSYQQCLPEGRECPPPGGGAKGDVFRRAYFRTRPTLSLASAIVVSDSLWAGLICKRLSCQEHVDGGG